MNKNSGGTVIAGIIGAGMAGPLAAILLARRGYAVTLFEQRSIKSLNRAYPDQNTRSFNLTLTERGLAAFRKVGLEKQVLAIAQPLSNRITHLAGRNPISTPYGNGTSEKLYSVQRSDLNRILVSAACVEPGVAFRDSTEFVNYRSGQLFLKDQVNEEFYSESFDFILGTDGVNSKVREMLHRGRPADIRREYFDWAYKEFSISNDEALRMGIDLDSLHVWPTGDSLLVAIPNKDGSMSGNLLLPRTGKMSLEALRTEDEWTTWIAARYPDLFQKVSDLSGSILGNRKTGYLQTLSTNLWTDSERVLLMGDAAHGVFPFYGQGMNSTLEDCLILDSLLDQTDNCFQIAFSRFERERKIDVDALCELSKQHFFELKGTKKRRSGLMTLLSGSSQIYSLVAHTTRPYREALQELKRQEKWDRAFAWTAVPVLALLIAAFVTQQPWAKAESKKNSKSTTITVQHEP